MVAELDHGPVKNEPEGTNPWKILFFVKLAIIVIGISAFFITNATKNNDIHDVSGLVTRVGAIESNYHSSDQVTFQLNGGQVFKCSTEIPICPLLKEGDRVTVTVGEYDVKDVQMVK